MALKEMLGNLFGKAIEQGREIADEFTLSKEERENFAQRDRDRMVRLMELTISEVQTRYNQVRDVIVAEMAQGDAYTKRARPTIVYVGLALHVVKMVGSGFGLAFDIDQEFTYVWGGVCGVWIVGRSVEKVGVNGRGGAAARVITGSASVPEL